MKGKSTASCTAAVLPLIHSFSFINSCKTSLENEESSPLVFETPLIYNPEEALDAAIDATLAQKKSNQIADDHESTPNSYAHLETHFDNVSRKEIEKTRFRNLRGAHVKSYGYGAIIAA